LQTKRTERLWANLVSSSEFNLPWLLCSAGSPHILLEELQVSPDETLDGSATSSMTFLCWEATTSHSITTSVDSFLGSALHAVCCQQSSQLPSAK
jgi:hypothetical protein